MEPYFTIKCCASFAGICMHIYSIFPSSGISTVAKSRTLQILSRSSGLPARSWQLAFAWRVLSRSLVLTSPLLIPLDPHRKAVLRFISFSASLGRICIGIGTSRKMIEISMMYFAEIDSVLWPLSGPQNNLLSIHKA